MVESNFKFASLTSKYLYLAASLPLRINCILRDEILELKTVLSIFPHVPVCVCMYTHTFKSLFLLLPLSCPSSLTMEILVSFWFGKEGPGLAK